MSALRFDPYSPEVQADPIPWLDELLAEHPVWPDPDGRWWAVARYDDVRKVVSDFETFRAGEGVVLDMDTDAFPPILTAVDPPQHTRMRRAVAGWFTARRVQQLEECLRTTVRTVLDDLAGEHEVDLVESFCARVPALAIADYVGVPRSDLPAFQGWLAQMIGDLAAPAAMEAMAASGAYIADAMRARLDAPSDDLLTACATASVDGEPLPENEKLGLAWVLLVGGLEATTFHLANTALRLACEPELRISLATDPARVPTALEEILRHDTPVQGDLRTCARTVELSGVEVPEGAKVMFLLGAANRDPRAFERATTLVYDRAPNAHLAFGGGVHFCLGAAFARVEARIAVEELLARYPSLQQSGDVRRTWTNTSFMYGVASLPVRLAPASSA